MKKRILLLFPLMLMLAMPLNMMARTLTGDVNEDGEVNIADVTSLIDGLLTGVDLTNGDVNKDGSVDISDVTKLIDILLTGEIDPELSTGEYAYLSDGTPAMVGQATVDHLFVRMDYDGATVDNTVKFAAGNPQLVWIWLDDDAIYQNEAVQALTPCPYNAAGDLYNEITYNSFQCDIYLPENVQIVTIEDEDGNVIDHEQGARLPTSTQFNISKKDNKTIDDVTYQVYTVMCYNVNSFGSHFSAMNGNKYAANGALHKDDAALLGIYLQLNDASATSIDDMIIANLEFDMRETHVANWGANESRFIYCTGGNNETQRFNLYNRVELLNE